MSQSVNDSKGESPCPCRGCTAAIELCGHRGAASHAEVPASTIHRRYPLDLRKRVRLCWLPALACAAGLRQYAVGSCLACMNRCPDDTHSCPAAHQVGEPAVSARPDGPIAKGEQVRQLLSSTRATARAGIHVAVYSLGNRSGIDHG